MTHPEFNFSSFSHGYFDRLSTGFRAVEYLRAGHSVEKVRSLILDDLATRDANAGGHINRVQAGADESDKFRGAASDALLARALIINPATKSRYAVDGANPTRGLALRELARMCLTRIGVRTDGMSALEMVGRAFTQSGSDFPDPAGSGDAQVAAGGLCHRRRYLAELVRQGNGQ